MKKVIKVSIPKPCHEDWDKMSQTQKGAFCKVCTKEVIDFTKTNDEDIVKHVLKNDNACGRFSKSQLDRDLILERSTGQKLAPLAASLLLPLTMMAGAVSTTKQGNISAKTYTSLGIGSLHKDANRIQVIVEGTITDTSGKPLSNVQIMVKESGKKVISDSNGYYKIIFLDKETLVFTKLGFEVIEQKFDDHNRNNNVKMVKEEIHMIMGEIAPMPIIEEHQDNSTVLIKGTINDDQGLPLPGANIIVRNTSTGTQSDFDGNYTIQAPANSVLLISFIGFEEEIIQLSNINNTIDVTLSTGHIMGDIVIVGGLSYSETKINPFDLFGNHKIKELSYEQRQLKKARKERAANTLAFKKLKLARKKAARKKGRQ